MSVNTSTSRENEPFPLLAVAILLLVGILGFGAFLVLAAFAPEMRGDTQGGANAISESAVGFAGLVELLQARGVATSINRVDPFQAKAALIVLTPPPQSLAPHALRAGAGSAVLIVLPKWQVISHPDHPRWVEREGLIEASQIQSVPPAPITLVRRTGRRQAVLHGGGVPFSGMINLALGPIDDLQVIDTDHAVQNWTPLLLDEDGATILARRTYPAGLPPTYLLSDPDLLDTQGLKSPAGARAAVTIIDHLRGDEAVVFDATLNGFGRAPNLLRLLFEPPGLGATVCAVATGLLILSMAVRRFGSTVPPPRVLDFGKRALADTAAGLIASAGRERRMAVPYASLIYARALRDVGIAPRLAPAEAERLLDAAARARGLESSYADLARKAADANTRASAFAVARRLFQWGKGLRRGSR